MEPGLNAIFPKTLWIKDSYSIDMPGALVAAYAKQFVAMGGRIEQAAIARVSETETGVTVMLEGGQNAALIRRFCVLGPWSKDVLETAGFSVPLAMERGYHMHFSGPKTGDNPARVDPAGL